MRPANRLFLLLLAICLPWRPSVVRAGQPTRLQVAAEDAALRGVDFLDSERGWAVGDRGVILGTEDGGRTWGRQPTPVECPLSGVSFVDRRHGWAVGGVTTPYTHSSHGVVLHTDNGGYTWSVLHDPLLPRLRGVRFFSRTHGIVWGEASHASPSGLFETRDGGQHWEALHSEEACDWLAASLPTPAGGLLVGSDGRIGRLNAGVVRLGELPPTPDARPRTAAIDQEGHGWVAGERSLLLATNNSGQTWEAHAEAGPIQWRGIAARGRRVWLVGAPGTLIANSADQGETWTWSKTGVRTPLNEVRFADDHHGWAVGDLGVILATSDGGQTWRAQRQGNLRCAALVVAPTAEAAPLELTAKLADAEGYRTACLGVFARPGPIGPQQDRWREALTGCGAVGGELAPGFALADSALEADAAGVEQMLAGVNGVDGLAEYFALQLAMLRPEVVLVAPAEQRGPSRLVESALLKAAAGEPTPRLQQLGLEACKPKRVLRVTGRRRGAPAGLSTTDFDAQLGSSLTQRTRRFQGILTRRPTPSTPRIGWTALAGGVAPSAASGDPLAGLVVDRGGDARRDYAEPDSGGLTVLKAQASKQPQFDALAEHVMGGSEWANRVLQLTGGLDAEAGAQQLLDLAMSYRRDGKSRLAADTLYLLARRYPDHALAEHAIDWMLRYYSSSETACHALAAYEALQQRAPLANVGPGGPPAPPSEWAPQLTLAEHQDRALTLAEYVQQSRPVLYSDPALRLALAAAARRQGRPDHSELLLAALAKRSAAEPFQRCAQAEAWVEGHRPTMAKPTLRVVDAAERPLLDGVLDEWCWQYREDSDPTTAEAGGAKVRLAADEQFLYLAVTADKLPGGAYPTDRAARSRDADLRGYDRVTLRLDRDRDYATAFELTVDCRGWTRDACWGDDSWDPQWFVAREVTNQGWTVEAAIPLQQLGCAQPPTGVWAASIERLAPGRAPHCWTGAAAADATPDAFGLLVLPERASEEQLADESQAAPR